VSTGRKDPGEVLKAARLHALEGRHEQALEAFEWVLDHSLEHEPAFYGVRLSYNLAEWVELGKDYPPARARLEEIRERKAAHLIAGGGDRQLFHDVESIDMWLGARERTHALFLKLLETAPLNAIAFAPLAMDALVAVRDYELAAKYSEPPEDELLRCEEQLRWGLDYQRRSRSGPRMDVHTEIYCEQVRRIIAILEGTGRKDQARACLEWAIALPERKVTRAKVARLLSNAGKRA